MGAEMEPPFGKAAQRRLAAEAFGITVVSIDDG
jgi:hypothetical protein